MILKESDGGDTPRKEHFSHTSLWLQINSLPVYAMTKAMRQFLGNQTRYVLEVETDDQGKFISHFLRVRIRFDVRSPLKQGSKIRLGTDRQVTWVDLWYEKLPEFCFICGHISHEGVQ